MNTRQATILTATAIFASSALAQTASYNIADGNSSASFGSDGQVSWIVDDVEQLFRQEFYFRRGGDNQELLLSSANMSLEGALTLDTNPFRDNRHDAFAQLYEDNNGMQIETLFTIRGGADGSRRADLAEQITIRNYSQSTLTLSFFQFVDFDLGGDFDDDFGQIINGNTIRQSDDEFMVSEVVVTPQPTLFQVGDAMDMYSMLNDGNTDDLNGTDSYQGNVAWAFQWNITLDAGDSFLITKDKSIVPSPGSMSLIGLAGLFVVPRRRG